MNILEVIADVKKKEPLYKVMFTTSDIGYDYHRMKVIVGEARKRVTAGGMYLEEANAFILYLDTLRYYKGDAVLIKI